MTGNNRYNRRDFLGSSARNAAGVAAGAMTLGLAQGASACDTLRVAVIGLGQQGQELLSHFAAQPDVRIVALCDVDNERIKKGQELLEVTASRGADTTGAHEDCLQRPDVDAVVIATPDHWHAVMAIEACQAGKDLYLEQPVSLTLEESLHIAQAAETSQRIVQTGLPQRSGAHFQSAVELLRSGKLGRVPLAKAWAVHRRRSIALCAAAPSPAGVDYNRWLGPAPARPFQSNRFHQNWSCFWDYGAGELGLWGVQLLDVVRWGLALETPVRVTATGGLRHFRDDRETPDTLNVQYEFPETTVLWEHRQWSNHGLEGRSAAVAFYGEHGTLVIDRGGWKVYDQAQSSLFADGSELRQSHVRNFIESVRTRSQPSADLRTGITSAALVHYGNLAWRSGQELVIDPATGKILGSDGLEQWMHRSYRSPWPLPEV